VPRTSLACAGLIVSLVIGYFSACDHEPRPAYIQAISDMLDWAG
jgi:hypothetical protein